MGIKCDGYRGAELLNNEFTIEHALMLESLNDGDDVGGWHLETIECVRQVGKFGTRLSWVVGIESDKATHPPRVSMARFL